MASHAAIVLVVFCLAAAAIAQEPAGKPSEALVKRIAELEKRVKELEAKLKAMIDRPRPAELDYTQTDEDKKIVKKLEEPLPANFEGNKLVNVVDYFRNTTGVDIYVDWARLEVAGVEHDLPVKFQLTKKPASLALKLLLEQANGGLSKDPMMYTVMHGMVIISTKRGLESIAQDKVKFKEEKKK